MTNKRLSLEPDGKREVSSTLLKYEPAHISRYLITARLIKQITGSIDRPKVLDVGGKKGLLRKFGIRSTIIDLEESNEKDYVQGDALNMPFEDNAFDVVVSCDVLEHIPAHKRRRFINEMVRVSKSYIIIAAPFNYSGVNKSEVQADLFYKSVAGESHRWLREHIENGLPDPKLIESYLDKEKLTYRSFRHLSLSIWDITTRIHFMESSFGDSKAIKSLAKKAYTTYYKDVCELDFSDTGYRSFYIINKAESFSLELPDTRSRIKAATTYKQYLEDSFLETLKSLAIERRASVAQGVDSARKLEQAHAEIHSANIELTRIKSSKPYKLASKLRKVKRISR
jgi:SAM-dependent methyltransferase